MGPGHDRPPTRRWREIGRRLVGVVAGVVITAYGASAAVSVALSDAETVADKGRDAVLAVPSLQRRYETAKYVAEHRQEIEAALERFRDAPPEPVLRDALDRSSATLGDIEATADAVDAARDAVGDLSPFNAFSTAKEAAGHLKNAYDARPDLDALRDLATFAEQVGPVADDADVLVGVYYGGLQQAVGNFSDDEIDGTVGVMAAALGLAFVLAQAVGFWARRGRPGLLARTLQGWGARRYRRWYVDTPQALSPPLYSAARDRLQREIVADPHEALDPDVLLELESWFASRSNRAP